MGAKASKPAQAASRKFPTRAPGSAVPPPPPPTSGPGYAARAGRQAGAKSAKDDAIRRDGQDPDLDPSHDLNASTNAPYAERLRKMGVATPFPTLSKSSTAGPYTGPSPSSTYTEISSSLSSPKTGTTTTTTTTSTSTSSTNPTSNPQTAFHPAAPRNRTLSALEARRDLQARAEAEFADPSRGREFLDAGLLRKVLLLHNSGAEAADIEARLGLKKGVVKRLGPRGVAVPIVGAAKQTWGGLHE
ncbi:hypothetical protein F4808DRAFT_462846 [Astrocystis sublimbata]|nr:hypothetical protein F4808DRAFT_462846 [Astrocystis sublimbata]